MLSKTQNASGKAGVPETCLAAGFETKYSAAAFGNPEKSHPVKRLIVRLALRGFIPFGAAHALIRLLGLVAS